MSGSIGSAIRGAMLDLDFVLFLEKYFAKLAVGGPAFHVVGSQTLDQM